MISVESAGSFDHLEGFLKKTKIENFRSYLDYYGRLGVEALAAETPVDTGVTAASWNYEIVEENGSINLYWTNSNKARDAIPIVQLIIYGHATGYGAYVAPNDFVSPVTQKIFEDMAETIWREVKDS